MTKKAEAAKQTTAVLLKVAREHFTRLGYFDVSLERIAEEGQVTRGAVYHHFKNKKGLFLAVLENVQQDVAAHIEKEAMKSEDGWQQLILGCLGFIKGANADECRQILLIDAPAVIGWQAWRKADSENSMNVLKEHIDTLKTQGFLEDSADTQLMVYAVSGALNELALCYTESPETDDILRKTIVQLVSGFQKNN